MSNIRRGCLVCGLILGVSLILAGFLATFLFPVVFHQMFQKMMAIVPGTPAHDAWKSPNIPTKIGIYLFSVRNPSEVTFGAKPELEEMGPYTYREETRRVESVFHDNGTVSFKNQKSWYFLQEESRSLSDVVTTVDLPQFAAAESVRGNSLGEAGLKPVLYWRPSLFVERTAEELLFKGYSDPLLTFGSMLAKSDIPMDRFGWFYARNGTTWNDGVLNMATGEHQPSELGELKLWRWSKRTHYPGSCGQVRGSAVGFLPADPHRHYFDLFSPDICRPLRFDLVENLTRHELAAQRFSLLPTTTFGNATTNTENACYYADKFPAGIHNSTGCKGGGNMPVFVSLPHFYGADPAYLKQFAEGSLSPDAARHSAHLVLQPDTSIPLEVTMRLQIMLQLRPNLNMGANFADLPDVFLPVLWFSAEASITKDMANQIWWLVHLPDVARYSGLVAVIMGSIATLFWTFKLRKDRKDSC